jgi:GNAT superfamily N-acetyltransferase
LEQVGLLRWKEWAYGAHDPAPFIEVTAKEAGRSGQLPMTLVAIEVAGGAVGAVGLGPVDDELSAAERADRTPWILGMVVRAENRKRGVGRQLLESLQDVAASLGHARTWVATGDEAVGFYQRCGWAAVQHLRLESTGVPTTILMRPTNAVAAREHAPRQREHGTGNPGQAGRLPESTVSEVQRKIFTPSVLDFHPGKRTG